MSWWDNATDFTELAFHITLPPGQWKVRADPQNPSMLIVYAPVLRSGLFELADLTSAEATVAATEHVRQIIEAVRHQYELPDPPRIRQA
ncbi:MAG TPA: hypothetical protein VIP98_16305 [Microlunatus sp.]